MLNIVFIGIANELPEHDDKYELHRLLSTLLSMEMPVDEKLGIMEKEYSISVDDRINVPKDVILSYFYPETPVTKMMEIRRQYE